MVAARGLLLLGLPALTAAVSIPIHQLRVKMAGAKVVAGADEDVYYVNLQIGTPPQSFRVQLDTGSYDLVIPSGTAADSGLSDCITCHPKRHPGYNPQDSSSSGKVGCHDEKCATVGSVEAGALPTICRLTDEQGHPSCPRAEAPRGSSLGRCVQDPEVTPGEGAGLTECIDRLAAPADCAAVRTAGYPCSYDMANLSPDPSLAGTLLSEMCPVTCDMCTTTRYCLDNTAWTDALGHTCADYAVPGVLKDSCFDHSEAFAACPVACEACGDCCGSFSGDADGCFFRSMYGDGSAVSGVKYTDVITLPGATAAASYSTLSTFGLITDEERNFVPDEEIDGVWGIGNIPADLNCNPSCGSMQPFEGLIAHDGQANQPDLFAICVSALEHGVDTWDIGAIEPDKYEGTIHYHAIKDPYSYEIYGPHHMSIGSTTVQLPSALRFYRTIFDLNSPGFEFPAALYNATVAAFKQEAPDSFTAGGLSTSQLMDTRCTGPVPVGATIESFGLPDIVVGLLEDSTDEIVNHRIPAYAYLVFEGTYVCHLLMSRPDNFQILGRPMMLANYIVFDRANQQIGLAQSTGNCGTGSGACEDDQFMCTDGECIPGDFHGDNVTDCRDGSDEIATTGQGGTTPGGPTTVPCVTLASPDHGAVAVNQVSRLATFQCDPGYVISSGDGVSAGEVVGPCSITGQWVGARPTCTPAGAVQCVEADSTRCTQYLHAGIACASIYSMGASIDCHCSCPPCDESAIMSACGGTTSVDTLADPCSDPCIQEVMGQWDACQSATGTVADIMARFTPVHDTCTGH